MERSHTSKLIEEAFEEIQRFNYRRFIDEIQNMSRCPQSRSFRHKKHTINSFLERIGLHLMYKSTLEELKCSSYSKMGKWSAVGTIQLALKSPERFDEVYNILSDEESKSIFDWFIKFRVAYAFVGEAAKLVFPPSISQEEFVNKVSNIGLDYRGFINLGNYRFISNPDTAVGPWIFDQYNLDGLCEVSSGDYVVDGGAFNGETAFWFLSKGAEGVYAFEPDRINFQILSKNVALNRVEGKIIPIKALLSEKDGISRIKLTGSASSSPLGDGGIEVECVTLDSFVVKNRLENINFIKLDVEGAETEVLKGAIETIKKYKPKMAISVYHKPEDLIVITKSLYDLLPNAKFYLSHKFYDWNETILFVNPRC